MDSLIVADCQREVADWVAGIGGVFGLDLAASIPNITPPSSGKCGAINNSQNSTDPSDDDSDETGSAVGGVLVLLFLGAIAGGVVFVLRRNKKDGNKQK